MTRTQVQQWVVVLLLILFVGVFLLNKKIPEPGGAAVPASSGAAPAGKPPGIAQPAVPAVAAPAAPDLSIPRDIFLLPTLLIQRLRQREQETLQFQQQKLQQAQADRTPAALAQQVGVTDLALQGIFWGVANPQAIINRQIVSVGDRIENAEVEAISRDSVVLMRDGQRFELKPALFRPQNKKKGAS